MRPSECKHESGLVKSVRVYGWYTEYIRMDGSTEEADNDSITYGPEPKTAKCPDCGKRLPNPAYRRTTK